MISNSIANEYAIAVLSIAKEDNKAQLFYNESNEILDLIKKDDDFKSIVYSTNLSTINKKEILNKIFKNQIDKQLVNLIQYIIDKKDEKYFKLIFLKIIELLSIELRILDVIITSAFEISEADIKKIEEKIAKKKNMIIKTKVIIDQKIIGGIILEFEGKTYDNSIKSKLEIIKLENKGVIR